jgi:TetR/AcrR family transcriptional regulator, repressor of fatR-cypB operon
MSETKTDKHEAILEASLKVFAENGFHSAPTSQIAKEAKVGIGTLYRYFENKDALIDAVHTNIHQQLHSMVNAGIDDEIPIRENLLKTLGDVFDFLINKPNDFRFLEMYYNSPYGLAKQRSEEDGCDKPLYNLFEKGIEQQIIKNIPKDVLFALCFGPMLMLIRDQFTGYFELNDDMIKMTLTACWDSIKL